MRERSPLPEREWAEHPRLERESRARDGSAGAASEALAREGMPPGGSQRDPAGRGPRRRRRAELAAAFEVRTAKRLEELSAPLVRMEASSAEAMAAWEGIAHSATGFLDDREREVLRDWASGTATGLRRSPRGVACRGGRGS